MAHNSSPLPASIPAPTAPVFQAVPSWLPSAWYYPSSIHVSPVKVTFNTLFFRTDMLVHSPPLLQGFPVHLPEAPVLSQLSGCETDQFWSAMVRQPEAPTVTMLTAPTVIMLTHHFLSPTLQFSASELRRLAYGSSKSANFFMTRE